MEIREAIEFGIFYVLEESLVQAQTNNHWQFLNPVYPPSSQPCVISPNYDLIIDTAMMYPAESRLREGGLPAYHCAISTDFYRQEASHFGTLLRLHGSLSWLHCKTCQRLEIGASDSRKCLNVLGWLVGPSLGAFFSLGASTYACPFIAVAVFLYCNSQCPAPTGGGGRPGEVCGPGMVQCQLPGRAPRCVHTPITAEMARIYGCPVNPL
ncbi:hypothetical protein SBA4_2310052 [Candidatus Sulfopaludibacter sp. SbA4]|nr:hypothetical protein SBA4_2310052 [Candidatus Sulfopaludibacter sp. SbA4]